MLRSTLLRGIAGVIGFLSDCSFTLPSATRSVQSLHTVTKTCACLLDFFFFFLVILLL